MGRKVGEKQLVVQFRVISKIDFEFVKHCVKFKVTIIHPGHKRNSCIQICGLVENV